MNVCNDGSSILVFKEPPDSNLASGIGAGGAEDPRRLDHWRSREFAERAAAKRATCSRAREIHQELAQFYARLVERKGAK